MIRRGRIGTTGLGTAGTAATLLGSAEPHKLNTYLYNDGPSTAFVGYSTGLTAANGYPLPPNQGNTVLFADYSGPVYAIVASGSAVIRKAVDYRG